jgi:ribosomal protein S18 acetylase RimI-like enzyme
MTAVESGLMWGVADLRIAGDDDLEVAGRLSGPGLDHLSTRLGDHLRGRVLVARKGPDTVGTVIVSWAPADEPEITALLPGVPLMYHLRVDEPHRCQGIGTSLIRRAEQMLRERGHDRVLIGVDQSNGRARRLYLALGYRPWPGLAGLPGDNGLYDILAADLRA